MSQGLIAAIDGVAKTQARGTAALRLKHGGYSAHQSPTYPSKICLKRYPAKLAGEAPMTDLMTGGRPEIGAARDPNSHEFAVHNGFHVPVTPLWQGIEEITTLMDRFKAASDTHAGPKPVLQLLWCLISE